ncbi:hypothetical protein EAE91_23895, partial [Photorhabdus noenieputensis]|nr:hypothetical protein [Photorhabdus noenieputensis]
IKHFVLFDKKRLDFNMHPQGGLNYSLIVCEINESINSKACCCPLRLFLFWLALNEAIPASIDCSPNLSGLTTENIFGWIFGS